MEARGKLGLARDELKKSWLKPVGENWCVPLVLEACSPALRSNWEGGEAGKVAGRWLSGWSFPFLLADPTRKVKHNALWGIKEGKTKIKNAKFAPQREKVQIYKGQWSGGGIFVFVLVLVRFHIFFFIIQISISQTRPPKQTTCISCLHLSCMLQPGESPLQTLKLEQLHEVQLYI